jgi:hypothetical protein
LGKVPEGGCSGVIHGYGLVRERGGVEKENVATEGGVTIMVRGRVIRRGREGTEGVEGERRRMMRYAVWEE